MLTHGTQGQRREQSGEEGARGHERPRVESLGVGSGGRKLTGSRVGMEAAGGSLRPEDVSAGGQGKA